jgi:hypothetical protein
MPWSRNPILRTRLFVPITLTLGCRPAAPEQSDHRHHRLLSARCDRPRDSRAAEKRDELAPPHVCSRQARIAPYHIVVENTALCITANLAANVSVGSEPEVTVLQQQWRLPPQRADIGEPRHRIRPDDLASMAEVPIRFNEHLDEEDRPLVFEHACKLGLEGIVSKRRISPYSSRRSPHWIKSKNPNAPGKKREAEESWTQSPRWQRWPSPPARNRRASSGVFGFNTPLLGACDEHRLRGEFLSSASPALYSDRLRSFRLGLNEAG